MTQGVEIDVNSNIYENNMIRDIIVNNIDDLLAIEGKTYQNNMSYFILFNII